MAAPTITIDAFTKVWPSSVIRSGGATVVIVGDCRHLGTLAPIEPLHLVSQSGILTTINLHAKTASGSTITGLMLDSTIDCRASDCIIEACHWFNVPRQCVRLRYGACRNIIRRCLMVRNPPFIASDIIAIQSVDGKNFDNVIEDNIILNYTDSIQSTDRANVDGSSDDYGACAGLKIRRNVLGFTETVSQSGINIAGCESALDFKTGGTPDNPVVVESNTIIGCRKSPGNPTHGYAATHHRCASDIIYRNNDFIDCGSAIFANIQYMRCVTKLGLFDPRITATGNRLTNTPTMVVGPGKITMESEAEELA